MWIGISNSQPSPTIKLSDVHTSLQIDTLATVYEWKNGKRGKPLKSEKGTAAGNEGMISFNIVNDLQTDTVVYYQGGLNGCITLLLSDTMGRLISRQVTGYYQPVQRRFGRDEDYFLPVQIRAGQTLSAQVIFKGYFGLDLRSWSKLYTYQTYLQYFRDEAGSENTQDFIIVFFTGASLMLLLFFWFMYIESRQALYGRYAFYLTLQWVYGMLKLGPSTLIGAGLLHLPVLRFVLVEPIVLAAVGSYAWFVNELLNLKQENRKLYRLLKWMAFMLWSYSLVFTIVSILFPDGSYRVSAFIIMRLILLSSNLFILIYIGAKVKSSVKSYYLIGNSLFLLFAIIAGFASQIDIFSTGYLDRLTVTTWYMIGILLECIFFAFGLGIRIKELQKNKQLIDEKLIEQMQVTEKMTKEANQQLEQKVTERTEKIQRQAKQLEEVRLQETRAAYEKQLSETRMQALRSRMNPHFIFNSLNSIKYFILKKENDTAEFYLNKFSRLLRLILDYTTHETITLQQELEALNVYLEIESVRFDKSFHYYIHVDESVNTEKVHIPPLLLQPFVENAIWHGLANSEKDEKFCQIDITRNNDKVLIQITDNGVGRGEAARINANKPSRHISHGLKITEDRITLFNNTNKGYLNIQVQDNMDEEGPAGTTVNITFKTP